MFDGLDHVWKAAEILATENSQLKDRLKQAAGEFYVSMMRKDEWPKDLLAGANGLDSALQDIDKMNLYSAQQAAKAMLSLATDVQIAQHEAYRANGGIDETKKPPETTPTQESQTNPHLVDEKLSGQTQSSAG